MEEGQGPPKDLAPPNPEPPIHTYESTEPAPPPGIPAPQDTPPQPNPSQGGPVPAAYSASAQYTNVQVGPQQVGMPQVVMGPLLTDLPGQIMCPVCQKQVTTEIKYKNGLLTWFLCGILAFFTGLLGMFIPFCLKASKDVEHRCPDCQNVLYIYRRIGA